MNPEFGLPDSPHANGCKEWGSESATTSLQTKWLPIKAGKDGNPKFAYSWSLTLQFERMQYLLNIFVTWKSKYKMQINFKVTSKIPISINHTPTDYGLTLTTAIWYMLKGFIHHFLNWLSFCLNKISIYSEKDQSKTFAASMDIERQSI